MAHVESSERSKLEQISRLKGLHGKTVEVAMLWPEDFDENGVLEEGTTNELLLAFSDSRTLLSILDPVFDFPTTKAISNLSPLLRGRRLSQADIKETELGNGVRIVLRGLHRQRNLIAILGGGFRITEINTQKSRG